MNTEGQDMSNKAYGMALYTEFRRGDSTSQMIVTSEAVDPVTKKVIPASIVNRTVSVDHQRKVWKMRTLSKTPNRTVDPSSGRLATNQSIAHAEKVATENLDELKRYFDGFAIGSWTLYKEPLFVEMSSDDVHAVAASTTPDALIRRILNARTDAGFDSSLFNGGV